MVRELIWTQSGALSKGSVLSDGDQAIASLSFASHFARQAYGEYAGRRIRFVREGLLHPLTRVLKAPMDEQMAVIRLRWRYSLKAEVELANGSVLQVFCHGITSRTWTIKDMQGRELCSLFERWKLLRSTGTLEFKDLGGGDPDVLFIAIIIWYIVNIVTYQESAVAASAGSS